MYSMENEESYSLRKITKWLATENVAKSKYKHNSSGGAMFSLCQTGIRLKLNEEFALSIQTSPMVCNEAFAETALFKNDTFVYDNALGYIDDIRRFDEPEQLFAHLKDLIERLKNVPVPEEDTEENVKRRKQY